MAFHNWRGTVGLIKPTMRPGSLEELIRMLPTGIGVIPLYLDFRRGTLREFDDGLQRYEEPVARLAEEGVDIIHPIGAPPFMVQGYEKEAHVLQGWETKYNVPVFTSGTNHVAALKALDIKRFVGITYFQNQLNSLFERYFVDAGFDVLAMEGIDVPFEHVGQLSSHEIYAHAKRVYLKYIGSADGIYVLGSGWRILDVIGTLEQDLKIPVVHPVAARCWEIQKRLHVHQPVTGYGRLLAEMP